MSALWLRFLTILCLPCVALSNPEEGGVVLRNLGESFTIHCRTAVSEQNLLSLKRGLHRNEVLATGTNTSAATISKEVEDRLHVTGVFPSLDLLITNLTMQDMGPYWCEYTAYDKTMETKEGNGAVLLVVNGGQQCSAENINAPLLALVGCAGSLLIFIIGFLFWIIAKSKTKKAKRTITNDVYEDMRGTLRR